MPRAAVSDAQTARGRDRALQTIRTARPAPAAPGGAKRAATHGMSAMASRHHLSALEAAFLGLESHDVPFVHVSVLSLDRPVGVEALRAHLAAAFAPIPRYRQRIAHRRFGAADWIDDPDDRIEHHVQTACVAAPGGARELEELAAHLIASELPPEHSPWRVWTVTGLADGRGAIIAAFHHALIDGVAGFRLLEQAFGPPAPAGSSAAPPRAARAGKLAVLRRLVARRNVVALGRLLRDGLRPASQIGLNPSRVGPVRVIASHAVDLVAIQATAHALGATSNDVVLAAVAGALRRFVARRDLDPAALRDVRAMVPIARHAKGSREAEGNRVVMLLVPLPVDEPDPAARLRRVTAATHALKTGHSVGGGDLLLALSEITTPAILAGVLRLALRLRGFNLIVTNIPGPTAPLYVLGARLLRVTPIVNLWPHQAVGIAVASYAGELVFGLQADRRVVPDVDRLRDDLVAELDALRDAATRALAAAPIAVPAASAAPVAQRG